MLADAAAVVSHCFNNEKLGNYWILSEIWSLFGTRLFQVRRLTRCGG